MLFPVIPPFASSLGADVTQVGLIVAAQLYVAAMFVVPAGMLSDRTGRKSLFLAGICLNLASFTLYLFSSDLSILTAARILGGLGSGALYPSSSSMVVDAVPAGKRGQALGWLTTSSQLGSMLGPAAGGFILKNSGFPAVFLSAIAISTVALVICVTKMKVTRVRIAPVVPNRFTLGWLWDRREIAALLSITFIMTGLASVTAFLPLYGKEINIAIDRVGLIIATLFLGSVLMRALGGWLSDRVGRAPVMLLGLLLTAGGILLISFFAQEVPLHIAGFTFGLGMGLALPASGALIADIAPAPVRGLAMATYAGAFHGGQALGATGLGLVAASMGFTDMYLMTAATIGATMLTVFLLTRHAAR